MRSTELVNLLRQEIAAKHGQQLPSAPPIPAAMIHFNAGDWQGLAGVTHALDAVYGMIDRMRNIGYLEKAGLKQRARELAAQQLGMRYL